MKTHFNYINHIMFTIEREIDNISSMIENEPIIITRRIESGVSSEELGTKLVEKHPKVAFLLTKTGQNKFEWLLAISEEHPTMRKSRERIFMNAYNAVVLSPAIYCPQIQGTTVSIDSLEKNWTYFSRVITDERYVNKIVNTVELIILTLLKNDGFVY